MVGVAFRIAVSSARKSCCTLNAWDPTVWLSWWTRCFKAFGASGGGLLLSIGLALSSTLAAKYQGAPLGWLWSIQVARPRGPYSKPVIWNSEQSRLNSTGALVPLD